MAGCPHGREPPTTEFGALFRFGRPVLEGLGQPMLQVGTALRPLLADHRVERRIAQHPRFLWRPRPGPVAQHAFEPGAGPGDRSPRPGVAGIGAEADPHHPPHLESVPEQQVLRLQVQPGTLRRRGQPGETHVDLGKPVPVGKRSRIPVGGHPHGLLRREADLGVREKPSRRRGGELLVDVSGGGTGVRHPGPRVPGAVLTGGRRQVRDVPPVKRLEADEAAVQNRMIHERLSGRGLPGTPRAGPGHHPGHPAREAEGCRPASRGLTLTLMT
jgi:hypothetical protein